MSKSQFPLRLTNGYWIAVRKILRFEYGYKLHEAVKSTKAYQTALKRAKIGDIVYHSSVEDTAQGIVDGEY